MRRRRPRASSVKTTAKLTRLNNTPVLSGELTADQGHHKGTGRADLPGRDGPTDHAGVATVEIMNIGSAGRRGSSLVQRCWSNVCWMSGHTMPPGLRLVLGRAVTDGGPARVSSPRREARLHLTAITR